LEQQLIFKKSQQMIKLKKKVISFL